MARTGNASNDKPYLVGFGYVDGFGPVTTDRLITHFGSAGKAWSAKKTELEKTGLSKVLVDRLVEFRAGFDPQRLEISQNAGLTLIKKSSLPPPGNNQRYRQDKSVYLGAIFSTEKLYPFRLRQINDPPPILYFPVADDLNPESCSKLVETVKELWQAPAVAIVGSRRASSYGRQVTESLTAGLVAAGVAIVSGMALGVDGVAHRTALEKGGKTVAVLGSGPDVAYPRQNQPIYEDLINSAKGFRGLIISEFAPATPPWQANFPRRNRIISGLADAVVVTEAAENSGSLITTHFAADQGREVMAVPGPITSYLTAGTSWLLKQGAKPVTGVEDILEELGLEKRSGHKKADRDLAGAEKKIFDLLQEGEKYIDDIIRDTGLNAEQTGSMLSNMELEGLVINFGGGKYGNRQ